MASPATPENEAIRELKSELVTEVKKSLDRIVGEAHTRKLITDDQKEELLELQGTKQQKAEKFMGFIIDTVKDPTTMDTFCELLCLPGCIESQRRLAQELKDLVKIKRNPGEAARKRMKPDSPGDERDDKPEGQATASTGGAGLDHPIFGERPIMNQLQHIKWRKQGEEKSLRVMEQIQDSWNDLGTTFGIPQSVLKGYARKQLNDDKDCCREVLQKWLLGGSKPRDAYPVTWNGLIKALEDTDKGEVADMLKEALPWKTN